MQDFNYFYSNCIELTFELSCCKYPSVKSLKEEWKLNLKSILNFVKTAQIGLKGLVFDKNTKTPIQGDKIIFLNLSRGQRSESQIILIEEHNTKKGTAVDH